MGLLLPHGSVPSYHCPIEVLCKQLFLLWPPDALAAFHAAGLLGLQAQDYPLVTLRGYIVFWGCAFTLITLAIALWKQETDHYAEAQERKRQRHRRHKRNAGSAVKSAKLEDGIAGAASGGYDDTTGAEWMQRRAEIISAYQKLWEVVSGCLNVVRIGAEKISDNSSVGVFLTAESARPVQNVWSFAGTGLAKHATGRQG